MSGWIIDDGPFGNLAQSFSATVLASWKRTRLIVAKATADAVDQDGSGNRRALLGPDDGDQPFEIIDIQLDDPAAEILFNHLRRDMGGGADLAEHQAIAWALVHSPEAVFVCQDKRAALIALAELGRGRVAHPFDLWLHLRDEGEISDGQFDDLCERTRRVDQALPGIPWRIQNPPPTP